MKLITAHQGRLLTTRFDVVNEAGIEPAWMAWGAPSMLGKVHEFIYGGASDARVAPCLPVIALAMGIDTAGARSPSSRGLMWLDTNNTFYPPSLATQGVPLSKLYLLRVRDSDVVRTAGECLACRGVGVVIVPLRVELTRIEARRLQLAAEAGGGMGLLLRSTRSRSLNIYAATTRWHISSIPGERTIQRWKVELLHGHGRRIGETFVLEQRREPHFITGDERRFYATEYEADSVRSIPAVAAGTTTAEPARATG